MTLVRRTPLKRTTPLRRRPARQRVVAIACVKRGCKRRPARGTDLCKTHARQECDRLFSLLVRAKNAGLCIRCGKPATDTSHVLSRRYLPVRWMLLNAELMCRGCHHWQHMHPIENELELAARIGPDTLAVLKEIALRGDRPNYPVILASLRAES